MQNTRIAVVAAMRADAQLVALLAAHPDDPALPAIFNAVKSQAPPVYNCVTYRIDTAAPDSRFRPPPIAGGQASVLDEYLSIEAWTQTEDSSPIEAIGERLKAIFDGQSLTFTGGRIFRAELLTEQPDLYDDKLNAWFGLYRFRLRIQKG